MPLDKFFGRGKTGEFTVELAGYHPQAGDGYSYRDPKYHFWFYIQPRPHAKREGYEIAVVDATTGRFEGSAPSVSPSDQKIIEENIAKYFEKFGLFDRKFTESNPSPTVAFTWRLNHEDRQ